MTRRTSLLTSSIISLGIAAQAHAQAAGQAPVLRPSDTRSHAIDDQASAIGDIIVTAQKRQESASTVGMAITAATGDQLKLANVNSVSGLTNIDPSFVVTNTVAGQPVYSIRGINYNDYSLASSPVVSVYSDEIPYAYSPMTKGATYDLERVEVLKGPQGTLYGQSSTGGAINYISAKPTQVSTAGIEGTYGSFNAVNINGFVSGPATSTLAARLAFNVDKGGSWQRSDTRDDRLGKKDSQKGRLLLDWKPSDRLKVNLNVNGWRDRSDSQVGQFVALTPQITSAVKLLPVLTSAIPAPQNAQAADWQPGTEPRLNEYFIQAAGRIEYKLSRNIQITYLGSYEYYSQDDLFEPQGITAENNQTFIGNVKSNFQEIRLGGAPRNGRFTWLIGGNYTENIANETQVVDFTQSTSAYSYVALGLAKLPTGHQQNVSTDDSRSKAAYFDLQYKLFDRLNLHGGARYTSTDITHTGCTEATDAIGVSSASALERALIATHPGSGPFIPAMLGACSTLGPQFAPQLFVGELDQHNVSWRIGADWTPVTRTLIYATISQGYKAGSFPTQTASSSSQYSPAVQESLRSYEIGLKSRYLRKFEVDGDIFYYDYKNKQLEGRVLDPVFGALSRLVNVPRSYEYGAELNIRLTPIRNLALSVQQTYLHSRVTSDTSGYDGFGVPVNYQGDAFPDAPAYTVIGDAQYNLDVSDKVSAFLGGKVTYRTSTPSLLGTDGYSKPPYLVGSTRIPAYALLSLRAGVQSKDGHWRFEAFGTNVTNTYYWTQEFKRGDTTVRYTGRPAEFGITVAFRN